MKSYDLPPEYEGLSPETARKLLNQFRTDIIADRDHPYNVAQHPQHEDFARVFGELNAMALQVDEEAAVREHIADLQDALGDDAELSPTESRALAARLMKTPDYMTHESGGERMEDGAREKLRRKIHALIVVADRVEAAENADQKADLEAAREAGLSPATEADDDELFEDDEA